jgi:DNA-binding response OmpR family regulator
MRVPTADDVFVSYLCRKVDRPVGSRPIESVRGTGHRLRRDGGRA